MEHSCKYCPTILSLVQFLFSFVNNRFFKFSLAKKAVLVTQSFMCLHDNTTQIMVTFHKLKGRWFKYLVYLNEFNTVKLRLITFDWVQKLTTEPKLTRSLHSIQFNLPNSR